jgi:hypothetical protein
MVKRFYSYSSILKRLPKNHHHLFLYLAINLAEHRNCSRFDRRTMPMLGKLTEGVTSGIPTIVDLIESLDPIVSSEPKHNQGQKVKDSLALDQ